MLQPASDIGESRVLDPAARSVEDQEARRVARLDRRLSDGIRWEVVVEVVDSESRRAHPESVAPGRMARPGAIGAGWLGEDAAWQYALCEVHDEGDRDDPHEWVDVAELPKRELDEHPGDEARADADADVEREGHEDQR